MWEALRKCLLRDVQVHVWAPQTIFTGAILVWAAVVSNPGFWCSCLCFPFHWEIARSQWSTRSCMIRPFVWSLSTSPTAWLPPCSSHTGLHAVPWTRNPPSHPFLLSPGWLAQPPWYSPVSHDFLPGLLHWNVVSLWRLSQLPYLKLLFSHTTPVLCHYCFPEHFAVWEIFLFKF